MQILPNFTNIKKFPVLEKGQETIYYYLTLVGGGTKIITQEEYFALVQLTKEN